MNERKPEDYVNAAEDYLELAHVLAGQGKISDQDFLERLILRPRTPYASSQDRCQHKGRFQ